MTTATERSSKLDAALPPAWRDALRPEDWEALRRLESAGRFSFQQLRETAAWLLDARMWGDENIPALARRLAAEGDAGHGPSWRDRAFTGLRRTHAAAAAQPKRYPGVPAAENPPAARFEEKELQGRVFKLCPAASERAVCCNLHVINVVENCASACSYCVLQTHYADARVAVPVNLKAKLAEIRLNPDRRYRISTGEYSDSLLYGNRNGILADLCAFAADHPNAVIEFKTKSANVAWLLDHPVPANVCCSWSLNPQTVIDAEEHRTASLVHRLDAARAVADRGLRVGFHLHPMLWYEGGDAEYAALIAELIRRFDPGEVLWVSLGTVTLLKEFLSAFRGKYRHSQLLQMEFETTPDGKLTYPFAVRADLYRRALKALWPWRDRVFQYLCMEHKPMWEALFGFAYPSMRAFDDTFNDSVFDKLARPSPA